MENNRIPQVALITKLEVKRKVGSAKLRWLVVMQGDLKMISTKG
jgi:hypothetical protein